MFESMNKRTLIVAGCSVAGLLILLIVVVFVVDAIKPHYVTYEEAEEKILLATKKYYEDNASSLPTEDGESNLSYSLLETGGYIKPLTEILQDGASCSANIIVTKYDDNFSYIPYLSCPGSYETKELFKVVLENNPTVSEGKGLYKMDNGYVFRGEVKNNFVSFNEELYRIISLENDNTIKIIQTKPTLLEGTSWDDRYNEDRNSTVGYNNYEVSRLKEKLNEISTTESYVTDLLKSKFVAKELCVGTRNSNDLAINSTSECAVMSKEKTLFGVISASEFARASLDENCKLITDVSCINYNFFTELRRNVWTLTASSGKSYRAYYLSTEGIKETNTSSVKRILFTTFISNRAFYKSGNGTETDPYIFR